MFNLIYLLIFLLMNMHLKKFFLYSDYIIIIKIGI